MSENTAPPSSARPANLPLGEEFLPRARRRYTQLWLAGAISLGLHVSAAALLFHWPPSRGAAVWAPDAISINITPTAVLDAVSEQALEQEAAPSPAVEAGQDVLKPVEPGEAAAAMEVKPEAQPVPASRDAQAADAVPEPAEKRPERPMTEAKAAPAAAPADKPRRKKRPPQRQRHAAAAGRGAKAHSGQVSASRGNRSDYAAVVRARIARHKPGRLPHRGTALVSFAISRSGALIYARLARSSGNAVIDAAALRAVRAAAPFSPPPGGRKYDTAIPFYFR